MAAGNGLDVLVSVVNALVAELADSDGVAGGVALPIPAGARMLPDLGERSERSIAAVREGLGTIAQSLGASGVERMRVRAVGAALNGVEATVRGQILIGDSAGLPALAPSFVFLVTLPIVNHRGAVELASRTSALLQEPGRSESTVRGSESVADPARPGDRDVESEPRGE